MENMLYPKKGLYFTLDDMVHTYAVGECTINLALHMLNNCREVG
uniref:Uncharacterized protein n=1 Tax=Setaria italica TaxID=4555 RepID=K3ZGU4_SETIT